MRKECAVLKQLIQRPGAQFAAHEAAVIISRVAENIFRPLERRGRAYLSCRGCLRFCSSRQGRERYQSEQLASGAELDRQRRKEKSGSSIEESDTGAIAGEGNRECLLPMMN